MIDQSLKYLIKHALTKYDEKQEVNFFNKYSSTTHEIGYSKNNAKIILHHKYNKNEYEERNWEILGKYYIKYNIWIWSWLLPNYALDKTNTARKLLQYGLNINAQNSTDMLYLKAELLNARLKINDTLQLQIHLALASYLSDDIDFILHHHNKKTDVKEYILVLKN